jgi:hypothetical protein
MKGWGMEIKLLQFVTEVRKYKKKKKKVLNLKKKEEK